MNIYDYFENDNLENENDYIPGYAPANTQTSGQTDPTRQEGRRVELPTFILHNISATVPPETVQAIRTFLESQGLGPNQISPNESVLTTTTPEPIESTTTTSSIVQPPSTTTTTMATTTTTTTTTVETTARPPAVTSEASSTTEKPATPSPTPGSANPPQPSTEAKPTSSAEGADLIPKWVSEQVSASSPSTAPAGETSLDQGLVKNQYFPEWVGGGTISSPFLPSLPAPGIPLSLQGGISSAQIVAGTGLFLILGYLLHRITLRAYRRAYRNTLFVRRTGTFLFF